MNGLRVTPGSYNNGGKQEILNRMTPASGYSNKINFNKNRTCLFSRHKICQHNGHLLWYSARIKQDTRIVSDFVTKSDLWKRFYKISRRMP
jgi:hypothetical protein